MRRLFLTLGAQASGKSSWIRDQDLSDWTVSADAIRALLSGYRTDEYGMAAIKYGQDNHAWNMLWDIVESRMQNGLTTIVDSTSLYAGAFKKPNKLRKKYFYQVYVLDFMENYFKDKDGNLDFSPEQASKVRARLKKQNRDRFSPVPDSAIDIYVERYLKMRDSFPDWVKVYPIDRHAESYSFLDLDHNTADMEKFDRIQIIGDIHADYDALMKVFDTHKKGTAYIFVGDYLDRGTKTLETFKFITQELKGKNIFFLNGNHEDGWAKWVQLREKHGQFATLSLPKLLDEYGEEKLDEIIKNFLKESKDYMIFDYFGKTYYVSHAGFEPYYAYAEDLGRFALLPSGALVYGVGNRGNTDWRNAPYARNIDEAWEKETHLTKNDINVHGHRNNFGEFTRLNSFNLTADGKFRWLTITKDKIEPHEIDSIDVPDLSDRLGQDPNINQHELNDGIIANNFSSRVFFSNNWTRERLKARGLFTRKDRIVGRGFNKFFQLNQNDIPGVDNTLDSLEYPVTVERKHNGFLGTVFYDDKANKLHVYSKGGYSEFSQLAEDVLKDTKTEDGKSWYDFMQEYYADEQNRDTTVLFEIVDPVKDPHIVIYHHKHAFPLAVITNDERGTVLNLSPDGNHNNETFSKLCQSILKNNYVATVNNKEELEEIINDYKNNFPTREGLVLYGQNKMLKIKLPYYLKAKELRSALDLAAKGRTKKRWYYGAERWFKHCEENNITEFSPELALQLNNGDIVRRLFMGEDE